MKTVLLGLLFLCVTLSTVKGLETFDAETIDTRRSNRADDTDEEVEVVGRRNEGGLGKPSLNPCEPCWSQGANMCKIHEKTVNDNQDIESTIQCMKGSKKLLEESSKKPNPYPGVQFERTLYHGHIIFSREPEPEVE